jgi:hypothetical protein
VKAVGAEIEGSNGGGILTMRHDGDHSPEGLS